MTAFEIRKLMREVYCQPEWVLIEELRDGTGYRQKGGYADGIALNCYPSRGLAILGFEIKVSRSDWLSELAKPDKAENFFKFTDRWYVVAPPEIVRPGELPAGWGLMTPMAKRFKIETEAEQRKADPMDRSMLASLLRNYTGCFVPKDSIEDRIKAAIELATKNAASDHKYKYEVLLKSVGDFEKASGVSICSGWESRQIGEAVRHVRQMLGYGKTPSATLKGNIRELGAIHQRLAGLVAGIEEEMSKFLAADTAEEAA